MSSETITRGNAHKTFYIQPTLAPVSVAANTTAAQTFTVPGLLTTDIVNCLGINGTQIAGIVVAEADVTAANTLSIQFGNLTGSGVIPSTGVYTIEVIRLEGPAPVNAA